MFFRLLVLFSFISINAFAFNYNLKDKQVAPNVYCFFGIPGEPNKENGGAIGNTCFIDRKTHYNIIDSGPTYSFAKQTYKYIAKKYGEKPVKYVMITHAHDDHHLGNDFFARKGATIVGSPHIEEHLNETRMKQSITEEAFAGTKIYLPDIRVKKSNENYDGIRAIILEPHAHTSSDIIYLDEKSGVIFVGDLVFNDRILSIRDGNLNGWISTLNKLEKIDFKYMVSGHGFDTSTKAHLNTKEYLMLLKQKVRAAIDDGIEIDDAAKLIKFDKFKSYKLYDILQSKNVFKSYQLLEWDEE